MVIYDVFLVPITCYLCTEIVGSGNVLKTPIFKPCNLNRSVMHFDVDVTIANNVHEQMRIPTKVVYIEKLDVDVED
jgi:hypothetical protein